MKTYFQSFLGEESVMFSDKQGWPALITSHIEHVHRLLSWSASNTFAPPEQSLAIRNIWFHRENYVTIPVGNESPRSCGVSRGPRMTFPQVVTPECFNRGSSPNFAWIPAKGMRE